MTQVLHWALEYRALPLVLIGLVLAGLSLLMSGRTPHELRQAQVVLRWFLLCSIGGLLGKSAGLDSPFGLSDALVPLVGFALLAWQFGAQRHRSVFARSRL